MHNIDRVLSPQDMYNESDYEASPFGGPLGGAEFESDAEAGGVLDEATLAAELLSVGNEAELEQFLGDLVKSVTKGVSNFAKSSVGRAVGGALKQVAKTALPSVGAALGSAIPIPGVGTAIGAMAGKALANALEFEGGPGEDREFEVAQNVVRLAAHAAQRALHAPPHANANAVAMQAIKGALRTVQSEVGAGPAPAAPAAAAGQSGRWVRRGNTIVLLGV